jgi:RNA polymerase sigma factor (sigma-70 family)
MSETEVNHLSQITTLWSIVQQAHQGDDPTAAAAREQLLARYRPAVHRYLHKVLADRDAADELSQDFALVFLRGDLRRADPGRGRFRNFVKTILFNMIASQRRRQRRAPRPLEEHDPEPAAEAVPGDSPEFDVCLREVILSRTWERLAEVERRGGPPLYAVLLLRVEQPKLASPEMAAELSRRLGRNLTAAGVRQNLHRAREKFADLLLDEVAQTLEAPTAADLAEELQDLGLLEYCRPALGRRAT